MRRLNDRLAAVGERAALPRGSRGDEPPAEADAGARSLGVWISLGRAARVVR